MDDKNRLIRYILAMAEKKKTIKVSVLGLDGAGKSTTVAYFTQTFYRELFIVKLGRSAYYYDQKTGEKIPLFAALLKKIDAMYEKYEKKQSRLGIVWASIYYVFAMRWMENRVRKKMKPDLIIASRDISIDTIVYINYYLPFVKHIPLGLKCFFVRLFSLFPMKSNLVIYLELDPAESIKRIKKREMKKEIDRSVMRTKSRYRHENFEALTAIAKNYQEYFKRISGKGKKTTVVFVDANKNNKERTEFCGKVIQSYIHKKKK